MCHCLIRVNVELTVTQQPPWIKAKTAQYSAAPNTYCSYKLHTQSKLLKGNEKETKRNLKNTILAKFDIKPTWACWSLCMWSMSMGLSVFLCDLRVREREGSLVLINMQIPTLSGFIKAKARWISSPLSDIH